MRINYFSTKLEEGKKKLEEARRDSIQSLRESVALLTPWFQTSSLWNRERKNFCHLMPPSLWYFVTAALGNEYNNVA